jgi:hypothetical protein
MNIDQGAKKLLAAPPQPCIICGDESIGPIVAGLFLQEKLNRMYRYTLCTECDIIPNKFQLVENVILKKEIVH